MAVEDGDSGERDINDCAREVWRIFKSIIVGPVKEDSVQFEHFLDEDIKIPS